MNRLAVLIITALFVATPSAHATTTFTGDPQGRAAGILATSKVPTPNVHVTLVEDFCPFIESVGWCYVPSTRTVYAKLTDPSGLLHEIAHAYDRQVMSDETRAWFTRQSSGNVGVAPKERFADLFSACATDPLRFGNPVHVGGYGGTYPRAVYRRICRYLRYYTPDTSWQTGRPIPWGKPPVMQGVPW